MSKLLAHPSQAVLLSCGVCLMPTLMGARVARMAQGLWQQGPNSHGAISLRSSLVPAPEPLGLPYVRVAFWLGLPLCPWVSLHPPSP